MYDVSLCSTSITVIKLKESAIKKSWQFRIEQEQRIYGINKTAGSWMIHKVKRQSLISKQRNVNKKSWT